MSQRIFIKHSTKSCVKFFLETYEFWSWTLPLQVAEELPNNYAAQRRDIPSVKNRKHGRGYRFQ